MPSTVIANHYSLLCTALELGSKTLAGQNRGGLVIVTLRRGPHRYTLHRTQERFAHSPTEIRRKAVQMEMSR